MPEKRINSLDGLRGIAALVVVFYHSMLVTPTIWNRVVGAPVKNPLQWILAYTPLRIVWAGGEAVWIFFVLSGFVLVRPYLAGRKMTIGNYYLRRALRLYIPFFGSFVIASVIKEIRPLASPGQSGWITLHQLPTTTYDKLRSLFLFAGDSSGLNSVWWSLRWEVWFSLLLPIVVILVRKFPTRGLLFFVVSLAICAASYPIYLLRPSLGTGHGNPTIYLPMFGVGVAIAMCEEQIRAKLKGLTRRSVIALVFLSSSMMTSTVAILDVFKHFGFPGGKAWFLAGPIGITGASGLVALAFGAPQFAKALDNRAIDWLGLRSYTLFLVHEPILVTFAVVFGLTTMTWWWIPFITIASLASAAIFYPIIEAPALRLVRRIPNGTTT